MCSSFSACVSRQVGVEPDVRVDDISQLPKDESAFCSALSEAELPAAQKVIEATRA